MNADSLATNLGNAPVFCLCRPERTTLFSACRGLVACPSSPAALPTMTALQNVAVTFLRLPMDRSRLPEVGLESTTIPRPNSQAYSRVVAAMVRTYISILPCISLFFSLQRYSIDQEPY